jgi:hypothetical protein
MPMNENVKKRGDAERVQKVKELTLIGVSPEIIQQMIDQHAQEFLNDAFNLLQEQQYHSAILKCFWALRLPDLSAKRTEFKRFALHAVDNLMDGQNGVNDIGAIGGPEFSDLAADLKEIWTATKSQLIMDQFKDLDDEPLLLKKDFEKLKDLLTQLKQQQPRTSERIAEAELRLPLEENAQLEFKAIIQDVQTFLERSDRTGFQDFLKELRERAAIAAGNAGGSKVGYGGQISDFVRNATDYIAQLHSEQFKHHMTLDVVADAEKDLADFRDALKDDANAGQILKMICETLRLSPDHRHFQRMQDLSVHWLKEKGRNAFRKLSQGLSGTEPMVIADAIADIENSAHVLPAEISEEFKDFLLRLQEALKLKLPSPASEVETEILPRAKQRLRERFREALLGLFYTNRSSK